MNRSLAVSLLAACGLAASASGQVVISQVYGGGASAGATYNRDYIELFNRGTSPVDVTGWSVHYAATTGSSWTRTALTGVIQPGQYYLVGGSSGAAGAALPTVDASGTLSMAATAGKVALMKTNVAMPAATLCPISMPDLIDFIGYGPLTNCAEGFPTTANLTVSTAALRADDGCVDTNDNASDFNNGAPNPRNTASSLNVCVVPPDQGDIVVTMTGPATCSVAGGGTLTFVVTVQNYGPDSTTADITIDLPGANISSVATNPVGPPPVGSQIFRSFSLANGAGQSFEVSFVPTASGLYTVNATGTSTAVDPTPYNNVAGMSTGVLFTPLTPPVPVILSTAAPFNTIMVPGPGGPISATIDNAAGFERMFRSPNGQRWVCTVDTTLTATEDEVLLVGNGNSAVGVVREGFTEGTLLNELIGPMDSVAAINDSGLVAFGCDTNSAPGLDEVIFKWDGTMLTVVAREGDLSPAPANISYLGFLNSTCMNNAGDVSFVNGTSTTNGTSWLTVSADGLTATILAQEDVTIPTGQAGGTTESFDFFSTGVTEGQGCFIGQSGDKSIRGEINTVPTTSDLVLVHNGVVVGQEGSDLPGFTSEPLLTILYNYVEHGGDFYAYGSNTGGSDWVLRNGVVIARRGQPITPSGTELWSDATYAQLFFFAVGDDSGNCVVGGVTDNADVGANAVLVYHPASGDPVIIAREGDPIDMNNNGLFDDDTYMSVFRDDKAFINDQNEFVVAVRFRDCEGQIAGAGNTGQAIVRIPLPALPPSCPADYNNSGQVSVQDIYDFLADWNAAVSGGTPVGNPDFNGVGGVTVQDIYDFLAAWNNAISNPPCGA